MSGLRQAAQALGGEVSGDQVLAPGPGHGPHDRSMAVRLDPKAPGGMVVHSFAGDDPLACKDMAREKLGYPVWEPTAQPAAPPVRRRTVATYDYPDAEGRPYQRVCRTEPKGFFQQHWTGERWVSGKGPGAKVPYNLPRILHAVHDTVFIVEGEKAADALNAAGKIATTSSEGAGKWTKDLNPWFTGKTVFILPDNDRPGADHAESVAANLQGIAATVRVVTLPDLPPKGDVVDWLAAGGDPGGLVDFCTAQPLWRPSSDEATAVVPYRAETLARPYVWRDPSSIPQRQFLYGRHLIRSFMSLTVAPSGMGKTALTRGEAVAMASGKALLGIQPPGRLRVWLWNGEDPGEESERGLAAIALHYGLKPEDLEGYLFTGCGREAELIIAEQTRDGIVINAPNVDAVIHLIKANSIDVTIIDPFVSSHRVTENDNNAIDRVAKAWTMIADQTGAAVELVHHVRKGAPGQEITVEDGRGAVALLAASRSARVLNPMSKEEGERAGVSRHRSYFREENGKANLAPPPEGSRWYKFESVSLGNGIGGGDSVGVVTPWAWPDAFDGVTPAHLQEVQRLIEAGNYRADPQAKAWAGEAVAAVLSLNLTDKNEAARAKHLLDRWEQEGLFGREQRPDGNRKQRPHLVVKRWAEA